MGSTKQCSEANCAGIAQKYVKVAPNFKSPGPFCLPLTHDFPVHLPLFLRKPLNQDNHGVAHHEVGVLVLVGVVAHTDSAVGQVAEHAAAVLPGDGGIPAAADGVTLLCAVEGVGLGGLH